MPSPRIQKMVNDFGEIGKEAEALYKAALGFMYDCISALRTEMEPMQLRLLTQKDEILATTLRLADFSMLAVREKTSLKIWLGLAKIGQSDIHVVFETTPTPAGIKVVIGKALKTVTISELSPTAKERPNLISECVDLIIEQAIGQAKEQIGVLSVNSWR